MIPVVSGEYYWKLADTEVMPGYPRRISEGWGGLPSNLDAALSWPDGKIYFFKVRTRCLMTEICRVMIEKDLIFKRKN